MVKRNNMSKGPSHNAFIVSGALRLHYVLSLLQRCSLDEKYFCSWLLLAFLLQQGHLFRYLQRIAFVRPPRSSWKDLQWMKTVCCKSSVQSKSDRFCKRHYFLARTLKKSPAPFAAPLPPVQIGDVSAQSLNGALILYAVFKTSQYCQRLRSPRCGLAMSSLQH